MSSDGELSLVSGFISLEKSTPAWQVCLCRPARKNALNLAMYSDLAQIFEAFASDPAARVLSLAGAPEVFSSGNDLQDFITEQGALSDIERSPIWRFMLAVCALDKPFVVVVEGAAIGIGVTLLLHADYVVASPQAVFSVPFAQLGLCPEFGASVLLPQQIGTKRAHDWLLSARQVLADEALLAGLVNVVDSAPSEALSKYCDQLLLVPARAQRESKRLLKAPQAEQLQNVMAQELRSFTTALQREEFQLAVSAFLKRKSS